MAAGFLLGLRHALDADHVAAVSALSARGSAAPWRLGFFWGLGHCATVLAAGLALAAFKLELSPAFSALLESLVGVMLMGLGALNLWGRDPGLWTVSVHSHEHDHSDLEHQGHGGEDEGRHEHPHSHVLELQRSWGQGGSAGRREWLSSLGVGMVHGLAGSAAAAFLVLGAVRSFAAALLYLALFSAGTMAGMLALTSLLSVPLRWLRKADPALRRRLLAATGLLSALIGAALLMENAPTVLASRLG